MANSVDKERAIRVIVSNAVKSYANGFSMRHLAEVDDENGVINMKIHNVFIAALGPEIQYYSALARSLDSSLGNMLESIRKSRTTDGEHLLYALNIPLCGGDVAKKLIEHYPVKELIETARLCMFDDEFASIDGIGPEKSAKFISWFKDDGNFARVQRLLKELTISEKAPVEKGTLCEGLTFVVTGDVHHYKNRNELKAYIESQGGKVTGSVSKSTNYLINNDATSQSSKNKKAHELGIPIITEDEFLEKFDKQ